VLPDTRRECIFPFTFTVCSLRAAADFQSGKYPVSEVSSESDRSLQVQTEVPLSVVESRGPLIDPCYYRCPLEDGDHEVGDRMWVNLRVDLSG
jgi:hypothetical protein